MSKYDLKSMTSPELAKYMESIGEKPFRARQLYEWIHKKQADGLEQMTNLPKALRQKLSEECILRGAQIIKEQHSRIDGTAKYLLQLQDGETIESVWMKYKHGNSVCVSSQVGCRMGCRFCASTVGGLIRNLTPAELLDQVYQIQRHTGQRISNVIIMGIGEPLDNFENVIRFIRMLSDENGLNISQRNITLSTCGLVDRIYDLIKENLTITLAISLHAPNDSLRQEMMPVAQRFSIEEIMEACRKYTEHTKRRITFEYTMVEGVNDEPEHAMQLCHLLRGMDGQGKTSYSNLFHVNLIPLNAVKGRMGKRSHREKIQNFQNILEKRHVKVTVRREMGSDIDAACGQLRNKASIS